MQITQQSFCFLKYTIDLPYLQIPHSESQPTRLEIIRKKKNPESSKKAKLDFAGNYLHSIYIVLGFLGDLEGV